MWIDKLASGVLRVRTPIGPRATFNLHCGNASICCGSFVISMCCLSKYSATGSND